MPQLANPFTIFVIGNDDRLAYLLQRYAEQSGYPIIFSKSAPAANHIDQLHPAAILFVSLDNLQASQELVESLSANEILVLVCVSQADGAYARELGADACLLHPLTYENFLAALSLAPSDAN